MKEAQDLKVLKILKIKKDQKPFDINRQDLNMLITDASRCLRRLAEEGLVIGITVEGKKYKQWNITKKGKKLLK